LALGAEEIIEAVGIVLKGARSRALTGERLLIAKHLHRY